MVYVPFGWDRYVPREPDVPLLHDDADARVLDVGGAGGPRWAEHCARHEAEEAGEDLRLLYVALTRARCQVVTWWVPATTTPTSPLHRLLFGRRSPGATPPATCPVPNDTAALTTLRGLAGADLAVEQVRDRPPASFTATGAGPEALAAARFTRTLDLAWRRTSYSALTAGVHGGHAGVVTEPEVREKDDEGPAPDLDDGFDDGAGGPGPASVNGAVPASREAAAPGVVAHRTRRRRGSGRPLPHGGPARRRRVRHARARRVRDAPTSPPPDLRAELLRPRPRRAGPPPHPGRRPRRAGRRARPRRPHPARPARRRPQPGRSRARRTGSRSSTSSCRSPEATRPARTSGSATSSRCCAATCHPTIRSPPTRTGSHRFRPSRCAATSPAASTPCCACAIPSGTRSSTTRRTGSGRSVPTARSPCSPRTTPPQRIAAAMMDAHYPLQALLYSAALHRFLRWRLAGLRPGAPPRRCAVPVPARDVRAGRPGGRRRALRRLLLAATRGARDGAVGPARSRYTVSGPGRRPVRRADRPRRHRGTGRVQRRGRARARRRARRRPDRAARRRGRRRRRAGAGAGRPRGAARLGVRRPGRGPRHGARRGRRARRRLRSAVARARGLGRSVCREPARRRRAGRAGRAAAAAGRRAALPGAVLAAGGAGPHGARPRAPTPCARQRRRWTWSGCAPGWTGCSAPRAIPGEHRQRLAAAVAALRPVTVLAGGPGTGKTTTVAKILALLRDRPGAPPRIALAAPTGKAAARLQEAVREAGVDDLPTASTLHRLLGWQPGSQPVPPRPVRPAALRRDRRRRDLDGVADDDGPAARRRASGRPAGAGRRPGPAGVGRGGRGPRRPRPRPRPSRTAPRHRPRARWACRPVSSTGS